MKTWRPPAGQDVQILSGKSPKAISKAMKHGPHSKNPGTLYKPMPWEMKPNPIQNPIIPGAGGVMQPITKPGGMSSISNPITGKPSAPSSWTTTIGNLIKKK